MGGLDARNQRVDGRTQRVELACAKGQPGRNVHYQTAGDHQGQCSEPDQDHVYKNGGHARQVWEEGRSRASGIGVTCYCEFADVTGRPRVLTQISLPHRVAGEV